MPINLEYTEIKGVLRCSSGLHIGGSRDEIEIGGVDSPIIRDPITKFPYIPGSSLKGKLRSLLERYEQKVMPDGNPHGCIDASCLVCKVFGTHLSNKTIHGPTRIIVRDSFLTEDSKKQLEEKLQTGSLYSQLKDTGTASGFGPRTVECVPAGAEFHFSIMIRSFNGEDKEIMLAFVKKGLSLIEKDYLGGGGSRGLGKVEIQFEG
jgi:CRISPR-associated protein Csm3